MTDLFHADDNATPLTEAERAELIPTHISLRGELNELEQKNVAGRMTIGKFRHLPVVRQGTLIGIVSIGGVVKSRVEEIDQEAKTLREYIQNA
jgi:CBS domain-containing protein